ncbi:DapH/DapD/GlmU-related protein [uncultured Agrobacterium sp.]|uniref:acyltransferase n=1 Tax=uncultured Agrobacterium sp. TaxID=157277 RepID=UPI0025D67196|nr:acyltransferase [uncultured Agrobacterium sp.]
MTPRVRKPKWGLNAFKPLRNAIVKVKWLYFTKIWGMDIHPTANFSLSAKLDRTNPKGVHIGAETYIAFDAAILTHDLSRGLYLDTRIGKRCFIGARSIILPGIEIGDECVIGSGSVVTKNVPSRSLVAGNPARILKSDIKIIARYGRMERPDEAPDTKGSKIPNGLENTFEQH